MHPIERLRYVARVEGASAADVAEEAASALAELAGMEPAGLVTSCRRLVERHPSNGPLWWLSARVLAGADPYDEAREAAAALRNDPTPRRLVDALPEEQSVLVVGWPDLTADAVRRRGDLELLVVDSGGDGSILARRIAADNDVTVVPDRGIGSAATVAGLVVLEASAAGPSGLLAAPGSHAAAAVARRAGVPVWAVVGVGRVLPGPLWDALLARLDDSGLEPWDREVELVPADLLSDAVTADGHVEPTAALSSPTCPVALELLKPAI